MQMKKSIKEERGSILVYVTTVLLAFTIILITLFFSSSSLRKMQFSTIVKLKEAYEVDLKNTEKIYETQLAKMTPQNEFDFKYKGELQTFTAPMDGVYSIEAVGASGTGGNTYGTSYVGTGGKGAKIIGTFTIKKGEIIDIAVGGEGKITQATAKDGTSGAGRTDGSFVFKRIPTVTDSKYQFTKGSINYETLLAVAGGGGSEDCAYRNANSTGYDGEAVNYKSPNNYTAYSTTTNVGTSGIGVASTMGISQFISYDLKGTFYTRNSGTGQGRIWSWWFTR